MKRLDMYFNTIHVLYTHLGGNTLNNSLFICFLTSLRHFPTRALFLLSPSLDISHLPFLLDLHC